MPFCRVQCFFVCAWLLQFMWNRYTFKATPFEVCYIHARAQCYSVCVYACMLHVSAQIPRPFLCWPTSSRWSRLHPIHSGSPAALTLFLWIVKSPRWRAWKRGRLSGSFPRRPSRSPPPGWIPQSEPSTDPEHNSTPSAAFSFSRLRMNLGLIPVVDIHWVFSPRLFSSWSCVYVPTHRSNTTLQRNNNKKRRPNSQPRRQAIPPPNTLRLLLLLLFLRALKRVLNHPAHFGCCPLVVVSDGFTFKWLEFINSSVWIQSHTREF